MNTGYTYSIFLNQVPIIELGMTSIDLIDLTIYTEMVNIMNVKSTQSINTVHGTYYWIAHKLLLSRLPILRIKSKPVIIRRINKLIECNMIERLDEQGMIKSYYRLTDFHEKYLTYTSIKNDTPLSKMKGGSIKNERGGLSKMKDNEINNNEINNKSCIDIAYTLWTDDHFKESILNNKKNYDSNELRKFYTYWTERSPKGKMRFQMQKTWSTAGRLTTWMSRVTPDKNTTQNGFENLMKFTDEQ